MITFEHIDIQNEKEVVIQLGSDDLTIEEVCQGFEDFLKACGYVLPEGAKIGHEYLPMSAFDSMGYEYQ